MAGTFKFELVSPEQVLVSADATEVVVPGMDGQFTVMAGHAPVISTLRPGVLEIKLAGGGVRRVFVRGGFVEVEPERLTILAQRLVDLSAAGGQAVQQEIKDAEAALAGARTDIDRMLARDAIDQLKALAA